MIFMCRRKNYPFFFPQFKLFPQILGVKSMFEINIVSLGILPDNSAADSRSETCLRNHIL